ncbi:MAG: PKD domain-containing protein [Candidatus Saccharibacteria bacterium]|nr:PKD domain-containing protein [Candidatus Saccharibacteria bacterium]
MKYKRLLSVLVCLLLVVFMAGVVGAQQEEGSIGLEGQVSAPPPENGATITVPSNGASFSDLPVTVQGVCPDGLLVKVFKNNVFAGSVQCEGGSYSIVIDLFGGQNELVARVFDDLDQPGPDSNIVTVTYDDPRAGAQDRVTLTSNFAKRGANPGQTLDWPIILSGGSSPYAISIDWGDGSEQQLLTREFAGTFDISHAYENPGVYNVIVKAVDANEGTAFLQLVAIANGPLSQEDGGDGAAGSGDGEQEARILWQPAAILIPFIIFTFWLGKKYQLKVIKQRIARGERPF